jgi:hypothetical protein
MTSQPLAEAFRAMVHAVATNDEHLPTITETFCEKLRGLTPDEKGMAMGLLLESYLREECPRCRDAVQVQVTAHVREHRRVGVDMRDVSIDTD